MFVEVLAAAAERQPHGSRGGGGQALLVDTLVGGPPVLFQGLTARERELVLTQGRRRVLNRGQTLFNQGAAHDGIFLIETGRIRVFYTAPSGREITLAYWQAGNFVGGPEIFGSGAHLWSGVAATNSTVVLLPGKILRTLVLQVPNLAIGLIEGLTFKGKCYSALAQMLGTHSITERLAQLLLHLGEAYGIKENRGIVIGAAFTHADLAHMVGATRQWVTISLQAATGSRRTRLPEIANHRAPSRGTQGHAGRRITLPIEEAILAFAAENMRRGVILGN